MNNSEYQKLYKLETTYWWHVGRRAIIAALISRDAPRTRGVSTTKQILDIGCGTGENIKFLSQFGKVTGIDTSKQAIEFCRKRDLNNIQLGRAENLPFEKDSFNLVTMLDLLEHLENDLLALRESFRVLKSEGMLLITAPAHPSLWSRHDVALNHKRRYTRKGFEATVTKAGFKIKRLSFAITTLFLPILCYRLLQKPFTRSEPKTSYVILPDWLNKYFIKLLKLEAKLINRTNLPIGVSLICIATK